MESNTKLYVKAETNCRGEIDYSYYTINLQKLIDAQNLRGKNDDDSEEALCNEEGGDFLYEIISGSFIRDNIETDWVALLEEKGHIGIESEEIIWGIGISKEQALIGFNSIPKGEEDGWDEED